MTIRFALALIVTLLAAFPALASPGCMTKHEARAHYGNSWIYWHGPDHCWDDRRGHVKRDVAATVHRRTTGEHKAVLSEREGQAVNLSPPVTSTSIWPDPPTDFTWADRWPNQDRISPDRWLMELVQFGSGGNR